MYMTKGVENEREKQGQVEPFHPLIYSEFSECSPAGTEAENCKCNSSLPHGWQNPVRCCNCIPGFPLMGCWNQELEPGIESRHTNVGCGHF